MPSENIDTEVRVKVDLLVKQEAEAIYAAAGYTLSGAFRMLLARTVAEQALPFDPLVPNAETIEAMRAARRGELTHFTTTNELFADLHADD